MKGLKDSEPEVRLAVLEALSQREDVDASRPISELVGDYDKSTASVSYNRGIRSTNHQLRRERILDPSELAALPRGRAVMLSSGTPAALIETVPWMTGRHASAVSASIPL